MVRILRLLCMPICLVFLALAVGLILSTLPRRTETKKTRKYIIGRLLLLLALLGLYALSIQPVANALILPLESHYPAADAEAMKDVEVIIVLGGGAYPASETRLHAALSGASLLRVIGAVRLLRTCNARYLLFTGHSSIEGAPTVAEVMRRAAIDMGVPSEKILIEKKASNTFEHPARILGAFPETKDMKIAVVTSAIHMPRSVAAFEEYFEPDRIVPAPVYWYHLKPPVAVSSYLPNDGSLNLSTMAFREYLGRLWYKIRPKPKVNRPTTEPTR